MKKLFAFILLAAAPAYASDTFDCGFGSGATVTAKSVQPDELQNNNKFKFIVDNKSVYVGKTMNNVLIWHSRVGSRLRLSDHNWQAFVYSDNGATVQVMRNISTGEAVMVRSSVEANEAAVEVHYGSCVNP